MSTEYFNCCWPCSHLMCGKGEETDVRTWFWQPRKNSFVGLAGVMIFWISWGARLQKQKERQQFTNLWKGYNTACNNGLVSVFFKKVWFWFSLTFGVANFYLEFSLILKDSLKSLQLSQISSPAQLQKMSVCYMCMFVCVCKSRLLCQAANTPS